MPNVRSLREIVVSLRGLVWKARDAGSPAAGDVMQMAAKAAQDVAVAEDRAKGAGAGDEKIGGAVRCESAATSEIDKGSVLALAIDFGRSRR